MSTVVELFGHSAEKRRKDWGRVVQEQRGIFLGKKCYKVRKSDPETSIGRQRLLKELGVRRSDAGETSEKAYGMNWKMTAKTILVQMHHKIQTFEHVHKKLVLVVQDTLLAYMNREFNFAHLKNPAVIGDSMHLHAYGMEKQLDKSFKLVMQSRLSTDAEGIATCLGLQAEARVELEQIVQALQAKLSPNTLFVPV